MLCLVVLTGLRALVSHHMFTKGSFCHVSIYLGPNLSNEAISDYSHAISCDDRIGNLNLQQHWQGL